MNITEFLEARIAEDEAAAQRHMAAASSHGLGDYPARILADCAAKRAIVATLKPEDLKEDWSVEASYASGVEDCIYALATTYADHPDYDPEWAE